MNLDNLSVEELLAEINKRGVTTQTVYIKDNQPVWADNGQRDQLTIPSLLPYEGITNNAEQPKPFSSVAARGVTNMADQLSALLPLNDLTYLYQALAKARETVAELKRAIEAKAFNEPSRWTGSSGYNADSNGNRETFYNWIEENEDKYHDR